MAGNLGPLPGAEMGVKFAAQFEDFALDALEFGLFPIVDGQAAQFLHFLFEPVDFFLALDRGGCTLFFFIRCAHQLTLWITSSPHILCTAAMKSGLTLIFFCDCTTAVVPSRAATSNTTVLGPAALANKSSSCFNADSFSLRKSRRSRNSAGPARSATSSSLRPSCKDSRVPASSICTRTFRSSGMPGFSKFSSRAKLSGKAS